VRRFEPGALLVIALGGALGAPARYEIAQALRAGSGFPWGTFIANVSGAFALGLFLTRVPAHRLARPFIATGFLGAFTTFSTLSIETVLLVRNHHTPTAVVYLLTTLVVGIGAAALGIAIMRRRPA
jgi:CrcB protein